MFGVGLAIVGVYTLVVLGLSLIHSVAGVLLILAGFGLASAGGLWFLVVAFQEDTTEGLLCLFVPFYTLYYTATRFDTVWPTLALQVIGLGMELLGILVIAWRGIVAGM